MKSIYKHAESQKAVQTWCQDRIDRWDMPHTTKKLELGDVMVHVTLIGNGPVAVVFIPGTNFNVATSMSAAEILGRYWSTAVIDVPGQPGLSSGGRPKRPHDGWYGRILSDTLQAIDARDVMLVGHSLGAAIALGCESDRIAGRLLCSPAGIIPLRVTPAVLTRSLWWLVKPSHQRSARMLQHFTAPDKTPSENTVAWMHRVSQECRSSLAPPTLTNHILNQRAQTPLMVAVGEHDVFLPPRPLTTATRDKLGVAVRVLPHVGHLVLEERPSDIAVLVAKLQERINRQQT